MERDLADYGAGGGQQSIRELREYEMDKRLRAIELQQATMHAALMHIPGKLDKLTDAVAAQSRSAPAVDPAQAQTLLAIQRTLDVLSKQQTTPASELIKLLQTPPPGAGGKTWALVGALSVVVALLGWQAFIG